jgi:hypothetical protein
VQVQVEVPVLVLVLVLAAMATRMLPRLSPPPLLASR